VLRDDRTQNVLEQDTRKQLVIGIDRQLATTPSSASCTVRCVGTERPPVSMGGMGQPGPSTRSSLRRPYSRGRCGGETAVATDIAPELSCHRPRRGVRIRRSQ
jgi:hypothetical protein